MDGVQNVAFSNRTKCYTLYGLLKSILDHYLLCVFLVRSDYHLMKALGSIRLIDHAGHTGSPPSQE